MEGNKNEWNVTFNCFWSSIFLFFWLNIYFLYIFSFFFWYVVINLRQVLNIQKCLTISCNLFSQRAEIVQWVVQGGGKVVDDPVKQNMHFTFSTLVDG